MDFFSTTNQSNKNPAQTHVDAFASAIARRFHTHSVSPNLVLPPTSSSTPTPTPSSPSFSFLLPESLHTIIYTTDTLVLDIRPHAAYSSARVPNAVSLSVPSTLLKRPLFSLQRLAAMLPSRNSRIRFAAWPTAKRIVVYDADALAIPDNSIILGLFRKFKNDGFQGELFWLKGGFQAVWRENRPIIDTRPPTPDNDQEDDEDDTSIQPGAPLSILRPRHLPPQAFSLSSTLMHNAPLNPASSKRTPSAHPNKLNAISSSSANPFFDTIRQNVELSQGITERIALRLPHRVRRRIHELPLPWLKRIAQRAGKCPSHRHPACHDSSSEDSPEEHPHPDQSLIDTNADVLAMQFYRIELAEQRRMMGIMEHHSNESGTITTDHPPKTLFPFSITAGVEKGAKNRYRHIWPFEHARVKLSQNEDDYVNASYVQPIGTRKRYIATQGPLPATFTDFWTLCWEQNVHVIVMLTREVEGAMVKCGAYWTDNQFGPLNLRLVSTTGVVDSSEEPSGFFSAYSSFDARSSRPSYPQGNPSSSHADKHRHYHKSETIKRVFELSNSHYPNAKPRKLIHLQYLEWPDMNVPDDPRGLLGLIKQVEESVVETGVRDQPTHHGPVDVLDMDEKTGIAKHALGTASPILLHCSAGVGRTGGFIVVDAILDSIKHHIRHHPQSKGDSMNIDPELFESPKGLDMSGTQAEKTLSTGHTVHVPVADPVDVEMHLDDTDVPPSAFDDPPTSKEWSGTTPPFHNTKTWAENVGAERGRGPTPRFSPLSIKKETFRHTPPRSLSTTTHSGASSSDDSSSADQTLFTNGSGNDMHRASSFGTSLSSGTPPGERPLPGKVKPKFNQPFSNEPRERTASAPVPASVEVGKSMASSMMKRVGAPLGLSLDLLSPVNGTLSSDPEKTASVSRRLFLGSFPFSVDAHQAAAKKRRGNPSESSSSKSFDYKDPRPLHDIRTPPSLDSFEEPIMEIIQDMREQRMSLCQSLRQYVFVHTAIIEGALMLLDEEKAMSEVEEKRKAGVGEKGVNFLVNSIRPRPRDGKKSRPMPPKTAPGHLASQRRSQSRSSSVSSSSHIPSRSPSQRRDSKRNPDSLGSRQTSPSPGGHTQTTLIRMRNTMSSDSGGGYASGGGKRSASPTELLKEGKKGEVLLSKRPSVKRKSSDGPAKAAAEVLEPPETPAVPPIMPHRRNQSAGMMPP